MLKALIFDLGGVIVPLDYAASYRAFAARTGVPGDEVARRIAGSELLIPFETGLIASEAFAAEMCRMFGVELTLAEFTELWGALFPKRTLIPEEFFAQLRGRYRLVLLSNTNALHFAYIRENYAFLKHFHDFTLSYEVRAMKPSPLIYADAVRRADCRPQECFYTDDVAVYVEAAIEAGIDAVQFTSYERVVAELLARDVKI